MVINNSAARTLQIDVARDEYQPRGEQQQQQQQQHIDGGGCGPAIAATLPAARIGTPYQSWLWQCRQHQGGIGDVKPEDCSSSSSHSSGWNSDEEKYAAGPAITPPFPGKIPRRYQTQHFLYKQLPEDLLRVWGEGALFLSHSTSPQQIPGCHLLLSEQQALPLPLPPTLLSAAQQLYFREQAFRQAVPSRPPQESKQSNRMEGDHFFGYIADNNNERYLAEEIYASDYMTDPPAGLDTPNTNRPHQSAAMDGYVSGGDLGHPSHIQASVVQPAQHPLAHPENQHYQQQQQMDDHFHSSTKNKAAVAEAMTTQRLLSTEAALKAQQENDGFRSMKWPSFQRQHPNMYSPPHFSFDSDYPSQNSMPAIFGDPSSINYVDLQHGLPNTLSTGGWNRSPAAVHNNSAAEMMPSTLAGGMTNGVDSSSRFLPSYNDNSGFGMGGTMAHHGACISPANSAVAYSSSASSGGASEAMASMSLDTPMGNTYHHMMAGGVDVGVGAPAAATMAESVFSIAANNMSPDLHTVSPKALRINPSPVPLSSEASNAALIYNGGDGSSRGDDLSAIVQNQHHQQQQQQQEESRQQQRMPATAPHGSTGTARLNAKGRKVLPEKPRSSRAGRNAYSPTPSSSKPSSSSSSGGGGKTARGHGRHHPEQILHAGDASRTLRGGEKPTASATSSAGSPAGSRPLADLKPKPARRALPTAPPATASSADAGELLGGGGGGGAAAAERREKDQFLVEAKRAGMTYREIRRKGGFQEAESTLRGRFRTLTKHKDARVRKPEWTEKDLHLLKKAVRKHARGDDPENTKVSWKQVAEYITANGGSYSFGNATCRKRWDELVAQENASG